MANEQNHYETLGVAPESSATEVRSAYRKLVLKHHPDRSPDAHSADKLMEVVKAYDVLGNPEQRRAYDALLAAKARDVARRQATVREPPQAPQAAKVPKPTKAATLTEDLTRLTSLFSKSRYADAEQLAIRIVEQNPKEALPYGVLGDIARARGNLPLAINMYARAVQADPRNHLYQQRYEELVRGDKGAVVMQSPSASVGRMAAPVAGGAVCIAACTYISLSREAPLAPGITPVSSWTLGLVVMLFLCGVVVGVSLSLGGLLDRFSSVSTNSLGKLAPAVALGTVAMVSYWAAAALYGIVGVSQNAFNFSTSRLVASVGLVTCLASFAAIFSERIAAGQVLLWGGNLAYMGAMCGWMVADSLSH